MDGIDSLKHLAWRAGYGLPPEQWLEPPSPDDYLRQLFVGDTRDIGPGMTSGHETMVDDRVEDMRRLNHDHFKQLRASWLHLQAFPSGSDLREKMALFWHGHFACHTILPGFAYRQLQVLRKHALGNFRDLAVAISQDGAMLHYLNNQQNRKGNPNENYARELMELFTIGRGHYTERDIRESARAFTGWSSDLSGNFVFRSQMHDFGTKTFMGRTGNLDGKDIIDILLEQEQTAYFITRKIYRYFINPTVDDSQVQELASFFYREDYDIGKLMHFLFTRTWFYDAGHRAARIKSPIELVAGLMRVAGVTSTDPKGLHVMMRRLGQVAFAPPSVAGWPGGRHWINSSTLPLRLQVPQFVLTSRSPRRTTEHPLQGTFYVSRNRLERRLKGMDTVLLADRLFPGSETPVVQNEGGSVDALIRLTSTPEYQMC